MSSAFDVHGEYFYFLTDGYRYVKYGCTANSLKQRIDSAKRHICKDLEPLLILKCTGYKSMQFESDYKSSLPWRAFYRKESYKVVGQDPYERCRSLTHRMLDTLINDHFLCDGGSEIFYIDKESEFFGQICYWCGSADRNDQILGMSMYDG